MGGEPLDFQVRQMLQPDAWVTGQHLAAERLRRQDASESELQAAAPIRVARPRATASVVARQQVMLARPERSRELQAQHPDELALAPEGRVLQRQERQALQQPEPREREPA